MPCEVKHRFLVLYGSQRGQAQSIAEGIADEAEEQGLVADICCLSQHDKYSLERERAPVVFVVSTTGDGEPPDTALKFFKNIKKKTLPTDHYAHLNYAILALGDTNYANFCNCGKTIDSRLQALGGKHFYATGHADDGVGLELVVDPWLEGLWNALKGALSKMASQQAENNESSRDSQPRDAGDSMNEPSESTASVKLSLLSLSDINSKSSDSPRVDPEQKAAEANSTSLSESIGTLAPPAVVEASLTCSLPPLSEASLNIPALPPPYVDVTLLQATTEEEASVLFNKENVHEVSISSVVQLTRDDSVKTALLLELDVSAHSMAYQPGDSFDVHCPNRDSEVGELLQRLGLQDQRNHRVQLSLRKDTKKKAAQLPPYVPETCTLSHLFTWCLEIRSVPKKAFLRALVECTGDSGQRRRLQELCSRQGSADYNLYVRDPSLGLLDLLTAFPACSPPLSLLLEHVPKLQPRPYSAASSSRRHPGKVHFVFNVVEFPACPGHPAGRRGLCTGWLSNLVDPMLHHGKAQSSSASLPPRVHVSPRPNASFRPPPDPSVPLIMVGPGTGVAPFIGFLQQREMEREDRPTVEFGETWLFYGCRHKDKDYLFREELQGFVGNGVLTHLKVCFSRDNPEEAGPRYVQHNLLLHATDIVDALFQRNGCLYICGDAKNMARDVNDTLVGMVGAALQLDKLEAMKRLATLREEKRYVQDIWS